MIKKVLKRLFGKKRYAELDYRRFIEKEELLKFIGSFKKEEEHYKLAFCILAFLGLRPNECLKLKLDNFSCDFKVLTIKLSKTRKAKTRQVIDELAEMIRAYVEKNISEIAKHKGHLFYCTNNNSKKGIMQLSTLRWKVLRKRRELGISDYLENNGKRHYRFNVYSLRRFFITELANNSKVQYAKDIIGHTKLSTTGKYIKPISNEFERKILADVFANYFTLRALPANQTTLNKFF